MDGFGKVCASLWDGTLGDQWEAWSLFVFMLAHADAKGVVDMTPGAISRRSCIPLDKVHSALAILSAPDGESRSKAEEGRRIIPLEAHREWGWRIVNYLLYRGKRDPEARKEQTLTAVRKYRDVKAGVSHCKPRKPPSAQAEAEAEESKTLPSLRSGSPGFEAFWSAYANPVGRRREKPKAIAEWRRQRCEAVYQDVLDGLGRYKRTREWLEGFMPYPAKWLKGRPWEDAEDLVEPDDGWSVTPRSA